jgi:hypothetical protein
MYTHLQKCRRVSSMKISSPVIKLKHEVGDDAWTRAKAKESSRNTGLSQTHHALEHSTEVSSPAGSAFRWHSLKHTTIIAHVR